MGFLEEYHEVVERVLLQNPKNLEGDLYKIALSDSELSDAEKELMEQRKSTLKILEKNVWMEKSWLERTGMQIMGQKYQFLEEILQNRGYRTREDCQATLRRYDLYEKQVQTGYDLKEIHGVLWKVLERIIKYQKEWNDKLPALRSCSEQVQRIGLVEENTKKKEDALTALQAYLTNYPLLEGEQQKKLQEVIKILTRHQQEEEITFPLEDEFSRKALIAVAEELKTKNKTEMHRFLEQLEVQENEKDYLDERLRYLCKATEEIEVVFKRMKRKGSELKKDFQGLELAKTGELLDPKITEQMETAERHHQETRELLNKDREMHEKNIQIINQDNQNDEKKVEAMMRGE